MDERYATDDAIRDLVTAFETATISRDKWKHAEHLVVAMFYLKDNDLETATAKMRDGILNLLTRGFGIDLEKEMPYHETLTVFWMRTALAFSEKHRELPFALRTAMLAGRFDKDHPLQWYSRELLFSDEARRTFVAPDKEEF